MSNNIVLKDKLLRANYNNPLSSYFNVSKILKIIKRKYF
jgi:hypothetical protein